MTKRQTRSLKNQLQRFKKLVELAAPDHILENEANLLAKMLLPLMEPDDTIPIAHSITSLHTRRIRAEVERN